MYSTCSHPAFFPQRLQDEGARLIWDRNVHKRQISIESLHAVMDIHQSWDTETGWRTRTLGSWMIASAKMVFMVRYGSGLALVMPAFNCGVFQARSVHTPSAESYERKERKRDGCGMLHCSTDLWSPAPHKPFVDHGPGVLSRPFRSSGTSRFGDRPCLGALDREGKQGVDVLQKPLRGGENAAFLEEQGFIWRGTSPTGLNKKGRAG
ncbi:hypothetical protein N658DRAFT_181689 [Parathielavia hyrcaniae]|uniref:Uncharacterized protein n=1 Tax=Parathielavia hyrcaniae TaxID=113614 RepID=A0AAN6Q7W3_9PEZI|nr:hypothetical protein N658DRAFT_181689 [Parathielavia hyrcaniae]